MEIIVCGELIQYENRLQFRGVIRAKTKKKPEGQDGVSNPSRVLARIGILKRSALNSGRSEERGARSLLFSPLFVRTSSKKKAVAKRRITEKMPCYLHRKSEVSIEVKE